VIRAQAPTDESLPLPENYFPGLAKLLDVALAQSPRMVSRNTDIVIAEADRISTRASQLPSAGGYLNWYPWTRDTRLNNNGASQVSNGDKLGYNFSINQPVFHWGALHNATKMAELREKMAKGQYAEGYRLLVEEIRGQYLLLILRKASLARAKFNQKIADDALNLARSKLEKHVIAEADLFGPTITAEQARLGTDRVQEDYNNALIAMGKLTGQPPMHDEDVPDAIPAVTPATSSIQRIAAKFKSGGEIDSFNLRYTRQQIETERLTYQINDKRLWPKFNAVVGISKDQQSYPGFDNTKYDVQSVYTGVAASWNIFDGFSAHGAKAASLARRRQLERNLADQQADLVQTIQSQQRQIEFSTRNLAIVEKLLESSKAGYEIAQEDLKRGLQSDAAVDASHLTFMDSQINAWLARNEYLMKVADFLSTTQQDPALGKLPAELR
jgi:outer membrane protein TolC